LTSKDAPDRRAWLRALRRENERQENALAPDFDANWGEIEPDHESFVSRFLTLLPSGGRVLDAACGTGKYFGMVLASGRSVLGVDHTGAYLDAARAKFPEVPTEKHDLENLPYEDEFDGVMCVDAMEFVAPEEWPGVCRRFRRSLRSQGWLYLSVELAADRLLQEANDEARRLGLPVVDREAIWDQPDGYYHYHPEMEQVREWIAGAGFIIQQELESPWVDDEYAYHHVLARGLDPRRGQFE
jgi:SAM-dependent methyltransferase